MFFFFTLLVLSSLNEAPLPLVANIEADVNNIENETINTSEGSIYTHG